MLHKLSATLLVALSLGLSVAACGKSKPPKQAEAPDALSDKGADMSAGASDGSGNVNPEVDKGAEDKMHTKCCGQCKTGLAKDRTGGAANTIPCADFTDTLDP